MGRYSPALAEHVIALAGLTTGQRVLDVGCGPGYLTATAAARVGAGSVAAVDTRAEFVACCRTAVPGVDARVASAERLPFAGGAFDAVLSQLVANLVADPSIALAEMVRVSRPGGLVVAAVWDLAGGMPLLDAFWETAAELDQSVASWRDDPEVRNTRPPRLRELFEAAGLVDVQVESALVGAAYESFNELWQPFREGAGSTTGPLVASLSRRRRADFAARLHRRLGAPEGPFCLQARARVVSGTRGLRAGPASSVGVR